MLQCHNYHSYTHKQLVLRNFISVVWYRNALTLICVYEKKKRLHCPLFVCDVLVLTPCICNNLGLIRHAYLGHNSLYEQSDLQLNKYKISKMNR